MSKMKARSLPARNAMPSVGPADRVWGYGGDNLIKSGGLDAEELRDLVHGDIGGVLVAREGAESKVRLLSDRWTGVQKRHLEMCADKAAAGAPGVVVIAIGSNKARVVFECLRRGLVNHLVIDDDLADALKNIIERARKRTEPSHFA